MEIVYVPRWQTERQSCLPESGELFRSGLTYLRLNHLQKSRYPMGFRVR